MPDLGAILREGAGALGLELPEETVAPLLRHLELLAKWNQKINLTAVTDPVEMVEKHLLDSLAVAPLVPAGTLLDAGTGAGFPGVPIRLVRPDVQVVLVDSVGKKVAFLKTLLAELKLTGARALSARLLGDPAREGLSTADAAVARAFSSPAEWLALAASYVRPGGTILVLAGPRDALPDGVGATALRRTAEYVLPFSKAQRRIGIYLRT